MRFSFKFRYVGGIAIWAVVGALVQVGCTPASVETNDTSSDANASSITTTAVIPPNRKFGVGSSGTETELSAAETLRRMIQVYQSTDSYQDQAIVTLRYVRDGVEMTDRANISVALDRPSRLRVEAYDLKLVANEEYVMASVHDEATSDLFGQVVSRKADAQLALESIYQDGVIFQAMVSGLGRHPVQLEMLLGEKPLDHFFQPEVQLEKLPTASWQGMSFDRVQATTAEGKFVFWMDANSGLLQRLEYPGKALIPQLASDPAVSTIQVEAIFRNASTAAQAESQSVTGRYFERPPHDAKLVERFVLPPQPLPTKLFGQKPAEYYFTDLSGNVVHDKDLIGKTIALAWFQNHEVCRHYLAEIGKAHDVLRKRKDVVVLAVCTEPRSTSDSQLKQLASQWQHGVPVVRDLQAFGRDVFALNGAPAIIILGPAGKVQIFEVGFNPNIATDLPAIVGRIQSGEDLAATVLKRSQEERAKYQSEFRNAVANALDL